MWALLAATPAVTMSRIDVGGNRAGTQTGYRAYGFGGQTRVLVEGINTTEGTSGAGFYFDYGSFEEVFLGTAAQGAEMPTPGVQSQFLGKSGGNKFQGEIYYDYERNSFQSQNIPDSVLSRGIRPHSNEIVNYRDSNLNFGGPLTKDKVWWYFSYRDQKNGVAQPNFRFTPNTFETRLWNPSGKVTYQANQTNKLIGYYQWGQKIQPHRLPGCCNSYAYTKPDYTFSQDSGSWVYKGEWNGTVSSRLYVEARYGVFGYYFRCWPILTRPITGATQAFRRCRVAIRNSRRTGSAASSPEPRRTSRTSFSAAATISSSVGSSCSRRSGMVICRPRAVTSSINSTTDGRSRWSLTSRRQERSAGSRRGPTATC
jgi:hypothetical protein